MQEPQSTAPGTPDALRQLADFMDQHGLTAPWVATQDHRHITGGFSYSVIVDSAAQLAAWAKAIDIDSFVSYRNRRAAQPICAVVRGDVGTTAFDVCWWTDRIPRVIVPAIGHHRSPLCSLEPLAGSAVA